MLLTVLNSEITYMVSVDFGKVVNFIAEEALPTLFATADSHKAYVILCVFLKQILEGIGAIDDQGVWINCGQIYYAAL